MRDALFHLKRTSGTSIQAKIREMLVSAILGGELSPGEALPSSRKMAKTLGVSRNTVVLAYQMLTDDGYLTARERSGFYVSEDILEGRLADPAPAPTAPAPQTGTDAPAWDARFADRPSRYLFVKTAHDWARHPYPFIYGQVDPAMFPLSAWRDCSRQALSRKDIDSWTGDQRGMDDPLLVEQIRTRLLPRRGIRAGNDQILVTMGAQNAIFLLASLLVSPQTRVAIEDPGYPDVRNILLSKTTNIHPIPVDEAGLPIDERLANIDYLFVTPSHQCPTTATLPLDRREALLDRAARNDFVIIEDDFECEANYVSEPTPALKSLDSDGRVVYIGSLSKSLFPGLRLGYLVGPADLIAELRALRYLMLRHTPNIIQRTTALFLSLGHHDALIHRMHKVYRERWRLMDMALNKHLPAASRAPTFGGTSYWVRGPKGLDASRLTEQALDKGITIEPGHVYYFHKNAPANEFRLGFSVMPDERIEPGIHILADLVRRQVN